MYSQGLDTPLGCLQVTATVTHITSVQFAEAQHQAAPNKLTQAAVQQLAEYFAGQRAHFDLPVSQAGTPFQQSVWSALTQIPFAQTRTYADIAKHIGNPNAVRAVGRANAANSLAILVPCHRVIGKSQQLVGYAGGVWRKQYLLAHELRVMSGEMSVTDHSMQVVTL